MVLTQVLSWCHFLFRWGNRDCEGQRDDPAPTGAWGLCPVEHEVWPVPFKPQRQDGEVLRTFCLVDKLSVRGVERGGPRGAEAQPQIWMWKRSETWDACVLYLKISFICNFVGNICTCSHEKKTLTQYRSWWVRRGISLPFPRGGLCFHFVEAFHPSLTFTPLHSRVRALRKSGLCFIERGASGCELTGRSGACVGSLVSSSFLETNHVTCKIT